MADQGQGDVERPLGGLPVTERELLRRAQIDVALIEVRYSADRNDIPSEQGVEIRNILEDAGLALPRIQPAQKQQIALNFTPTGAASQVEIQSRGWQMISSDEHLVITIMPDAIAIQTTNYHRWSESIRPPLEALLVAIGKIFSPDLLHRIGLRYVNRLVDAEATTTAAWATRISPPFVGAISDPNLGPLLSATQQQLDLSLGDGRAALIRHGAFRDTAVGSSFSYLVDIDVFLAQSSDFSPDQVLTEARQLNITALSLFQQVVTPEYRAQMYPVPLDAKGKPLDDSPTGGKR
jgi:uncharacterized protein (TIGR04255 family)